VREIDDDRLAYTECDPRSLAAMAIGCARGLATSASAAAAARGEAAHDPMTIATAATRSAVPVAM
jgi:hypothetical protein